MAGATIGEHMAEACRVALAELADAKAHRLAVGAAYSKACQRDEPGLVLAEHSRRLAAANLAEHNARTARDSLGLQLVELAAAGAVK